MVSYEEKSWIEYSRKPKKYFLSFFRYGGWWQISSFLEILDSIFYLTWFLRIFSPMTNLTLDCFITFSNDWICLTCFSNHSCHRVSNPLILWRPPYIVYLPSFLGFVQPPSPLPHHLQPPTSTSTALFLVLFLWQNR